MAQNVTIAGASYEDVSGIEVPKTGNNAGTALFSDVTDTTAEAGDVVSGKYFYSAAGVKTAGTRSATSLDPAVNSENLLLDSTVTPVIDTPDRVKTFKIVHTYSSTSYKLTAAGLRVYDTTANIYIYRVYPTQVLYLKIPADTPGVYMFQNENGSNVPTSGTNNYLVGSVVTTAVDDFITVPTNAAYLVISVLKTNTTYEVKSSMIDISTADDVSRITLPNGNAYDIKDTVARRGFLCGYVDPDNSTYNNYKVVVPDLVADASGLKTGTAIYIYNGYTSGLSGYALRINVNNIGLKPVYIMNSASGDTTAITVTNFPIKKSHLLIYDEYYMGGSWLLVNVSITNSIGYGSGWQVPTAAGVMSYVTDQLNTRVPEIPIDNTIIYITEDPDTSYIATEDSGIYRWPNTNGYQVWCPIGQTWPDEGEPSIVVPSYLLLTEVIPNPEDENPSYTLYSQLFYNGYYEFQFTYDYNYEAYDVKWYFRTISLSGAEVTTNKVTSLSSSSTDTQYPSAKCVYDIIGDVESALAALR